MTENWLQKISGKSAKARNDQRKVISSLLNAAGIGSIAGVFIDMAREDSQFDTLGSIFLFIVGLVSILLNYALASRIEEE